MPTGPYAFEGVNGDLLHEVHQTFTGYLFDSLGQNPRWSQTLDIANDLPVKGNVAKAKMASLAYGVHEWVDERHKAKIEHADHEVEVKRWANAISLKIDDLEDEDLNLGQYRMLISEMGDDFVEHRHRLFTDLLQAGFGLSLGAAYDGQAFFDSDHPLPGGATQSNVSNITFSETNLYTAIKKMEDMKKPNGLHANIIPTHGIFPTTLRAAVEAVLKSEFVETSTGMKSNILKNRLEPIFDPRLSSTTAWYLIDASKMLKPFFWAPRKQVTPQMDMSDEFEEGIAKWGSYARYNASYGFYQTMWGSTGA